jgi:hypothetical protein
MVSINPQYLIEAVSKLFEFKTNDIVIKYIESERIKELIDNPKFEQ